MGNQVSSIWFLHHYAGTLMYLPDVLELVDMVISDVQIVFDSVTNMSDHKFQFGNTGTAAQEWFRETGQFSLEDMKEALHHHEKDEELVNFVPWRDIMVALIKYYDIWTAGPFDGSKYIKEIEVEDLQRALSEVADDHIPTYRSTGDSSGTPPYNSSHQAVHSKFKPVKIWTEFQNLQLYALHPDQKASEEELLKFFESEPLSLVPAPRMICYECEYVYLLESLQQTLWVMINLILLLRALKRIEFSLDLVLILIQ